MTLDKITNNQQSNNIEPDQSSSIIDSFLIEYEKLVKIIGKEQAKNYLNNLLNKLN